MHIDLTGKTILVTGASRGIGRSLAEGLAGAGATLAAHFNQSRTATEALADALGHDARAFQADLAEPASCERLFEAVVETYGRLDVLVNNAGIALKIPFGVATDEWRRGWDLTMAVNLRAVELLSHLAVSHFQQHGGGRIINVASRAVFRGDSPEYLAYAASKGGVVALTRSIARAIGKAGNVLTVGPAGTRALAAGQPDVLLRDGRDCVEGRPARRLQVGFNQRCGAGIRRVSMCHPLRDNPVYHVEDLAQFEGLYQAILASAWNRIWRVARVSRCLGRATERALFSRSIAPPDWCGQRGVGLTVSFDLKSEHNQWSTPKRSNATSVVPG